MDTTTQTERPNVTVAKSAMDVTMGNQQPRVQGNLGEGPEISRAELTMQVPGVPTILTDEQRAEIGRLYTHRRISLNQLARQFHVRNSRIRDILVESGIEVQTKAHMENLRRFNDSAEGKQHARALSKLNAWRPGYTPTSAQLESGRSNLIAYNKSDGHRSVAQEMGKKHGAKNMKDWAQSDAGRKHARQQGLRTSDEFDVRSAPCIRAGLMARVSRHQKSLYELLNLVFGQDTILEHHPVGTRYFIDIAILSKKIAIEVDDANHAKYPAQRESDAVRQAHLEGLGWRFIRFTNEQIDDHCQECFREVLSFAGVDLTVSVLPTTSACLRSSNDRMKI